LFTDTKPTKLRAREKTQTDNACNKRTRKRNQKKKKKAMVGKVPRGGGKGKLGKRRKPLKWQVSSDRGINKGKNQDGKKGLKVSKKKKERERKERGKKLGWSRDKNKPLRKGGWPEDAPVIQGVHEGETTILKKGDFKNNGGRKKIWVNGIGVELENEGERRVKNPFGAWGRGYINQRFVKKKQRGSSREKKWGVGVLHAK